MDTLAMINECRIGFESRPTFGTKEALDILVDGDLVDSESRSTSETLWARWACVWPFSYKPNNYFLLWTLSTDVVGQLRNGHQLLLVVISHQHKTTFLAVKFIDCVGLH